MGRPLVTGQVERIGLSRSFITVNGKVFFHTIMNHRSAIRLALSKIGMYGPGLGIIGHRVVHGGQLFSSPIIITKKNLRQIESFSPLAPLHNPKNIEVIKECRKQFPRTKNVAVFDTGIFCSIPEEYAKYALPLSLSNKLGIKKYGFHGISHGYAAKQAGIQLKKTLRTLNVLTIHLGNGCSLAAFKKGHAIDSSLGFTPTAGLVMGTRSGDLDPIIPLYIQKKMHLSPVRVEQILNNESGLLGLSGFSSDMREILKAAGYPVVRYVGRPSFSSQQRKNAKLALKVFIARLQLYISAYAGIIGNVHAVVFTGSMGERSSIIRRLALKNLSILRNVPVLVVKTDEELAIAQACKNIV
jgi:acetate kinase